MILNLLTSEEVSADATDQCLAIMVRALGNNTLRTIQDYCTAKEALFILHDRYTELRW